MAYAYVLFPGRHHLLTRFQAAYLERAVAVGVPDTKGEHADCRGAQVVFAVTSADHGTTRRNPLPAHRREAQIERYAALRGDGLPRLPDRRRAADGALRGVPAGGDRRPGGAGADAGEHGRRLLDARGDRALRGARLPHPARRARPGRAAPVGRARDARRGPGDARDAPGERAAVGALRAARAGAPRARRPAAHRRGRADRDARLQHLRARLRHRRGAQVGAAARGRAAGPDRRRRLRRRLAAARDRRRPGVRGVRPVRDRGRPPALRRVRAPPRPGRVREPEHVLLPAHDRPGRRCSRPPASTRR